MGKKRARYAGTYKITNKLSAIASHEVTVTIIPLLFVLIFSNFFPSISHAWWSTGAAESVHHKISNKAFDLVGSRLNNNAFLVAYRDSIVAYTTSSSNDREAHGGNSERNGGDIVQWYSLFHVAYSERKFDEAAKYLGYCIHLIEDMSVLAHAYNIPHYQYSDPLDFDNFEFMADQYLNKLNITTLSDQVIIETDHPDDPTVYYSRARNSTKSNISSDGFSDFWHEGSSGDWNGDGPAGYYNDETDLKDQKEKETGITGKDRDIEGGKT